MVARRNADGFVEVGFTAEAMVVEALVEMVARLAMMVALEAAEQLVNDYRRMVTLAPIFDPRSWLRGHHSAGDHAKLAAASLAFRKTIGELAR
jgi:hypothetical protein